MNIYPWDNQSADLLRYLDDNCCGDDVVPGAAYTARLDAWRIFDESALREFINQE